MGAQPEFRPYLRSLANSEGLVAPPRRFFSVGVQEAAFSHRLWGAWVTGPAASRKA